ncbi:hypothetical protein ACFX2I_024243 [Malus domestica]
MAQGLWETMAQGVSAAMSRVLHPLVPNTSTVPAPRLVIFDAPLRNFPPSLGSRSNRSRSAQDSSWIDGRGRRDPVTGVAEAEQSDYGEGGCATGAISSTDADSEQNPNPSIPIVR